MTDIHTWDVTPKEAVEIQKKLQSKVKIKPFRGEIKYIAGADISMNLFSKDIYAGIMVMTFPECEFVEYRITKALTRFPYIPGLLSFREVPALLETWNKLLQKPDVLVVDGQGIAHPRRMGIASHIGVLLNVPTIGCAKSPLYGNFREPGKLPGASSIIYDSPKGEASKYNKKEVIGMALRTKKNANPIIISPGHKIDVEGSVEILKQCNRGYRLPEPTRQAHELVNRFRIGEIQER
jgi:deoxyribonuclease V